MTEKDLLKALGKIDEKYISDANNFGISTDKPIEEKHTESIVMGVEVMGKQNVWKKILSVTTAAAAIGLIVGTTLHFRNNLNETTTPAADVSATENNEATASDSIITQEQQVTTEAPSEYSIEIGDGLYRVSSMPKREKVTVTCEYGEALRSKGATAEAYGKTLDFSSIPDEYNNDYIEYCVLDDESTVYFADYFNFYKSDIDMTSPEILFKLSDYSEKLPAVITELISFPDTDVLFFRGLWNGESCVGNLNPETGEANYMPATYSMKTVFCNNGIIMCDYLDNDTALYWEKGQFYEIPLNHPSEGELGSYISADGKYLCTKLWGKTEDSCLIEKYSVYDTKSGELIKSFDWTFSKKVGEQLPTGFSVIDVNAETQSVYLLNTEDDELYQFYFGG